MCRQAARPHTQLLPTVAHVEAMELAPPVQRNSASFPNIQYVKGRIEDHIPVDHPPHQELGHGRHVRIHHDGEEQR